LSFHIFYLPLVRRLLNLENLKESSWLKDVQKI